MLIDNLAVLDDDDGRQRTNLVGISDIGLPLDIDLDDLHRTGEFDSELVLDPMSSFTRCGTRSRATRS